MMRKHVMSMTYAPKIPAVLSGDCSQTIRVGRRFAVGDSILMHGWSGRPYRSKWSWRKRVTVIQIDNITISEAGIQFYFSDMEVPLSEWNSFWVTSLAIIDFIDPPTGESLKDVLFGLNGAPEEPQKYQIIRW